MDLGLTGKVAVVTGGSRGIGFAAAKALIAEGAHVVVCARGAEQLRMAVEQVRAVATNGAKAAGVTADVSTEAGVATVIDAAVATFGRLDVLVNNVGLAKGADLESTTDADWQDAFDQTLFPAIRASRLAVPHMRKQGGGAIVTVSSIFGRESGGRMTYNAVKAAEISLTKSLAQQLAKDQIRVVSVAPGSILFEGGSWWKRVQADPKGMADFVARELPFGRFGKPDEIGAAIAFLASPKASWVSGTTVVVDGCQSRMF
ncbi:MAG: short-chain dehydrogenase [Acidobacterium sp.]|nr:SDR family oxidoreductase [Acidobacteriota bacterium]PHY11635.1 MAG: short-chain dehydrogenase [Acidobacterium sp.]